MASIQSAFNEGEWTWQSEANCRGADAEMFFPSSDQDPAPAKAICGECAVRASCLAFALTRGERFGIWGGLTERERSRLNPVERQAVLAAARREATQHAAA